MGRAVTISKIYRTCLNLKQFKMIKKRTVKQIFHILQCYVDDTFPFSFAAFAASLSGFQILCAW